MKLKEMYKFIFCNEGDISSSKWIALSAKAPIVTTRAYEIEAPGRLKTPKGLPLHHETSK